MKKKEKKRKNTYDLGGQTLTNSTQSHIMSAATLSSISPCQMRWFQLSLIRIQKHKQHSVNEA